MSWLEPVILRLDEVSLVPLSASHHDALCEAVKDGELWKLWYTSVPAPEAMEQEIARRLALQAKGEMLPFTVLAAARPVGMTTFMNADAANRRVEIGSTWYARSCQRSGVNSRCKLMLLAHAFETLEAIAVELRTHVMNRQSRAAIERLGAKLDGVLRNHSRARNGTLRDTCVYSILPGEWPTVKANLEWQIERHAGPIAAPAPKA
ncbi:MAG: GNAT family protein [Hyphomicrobiaceae bacterium]|nr:GNAT family protein [Hyphomicrobiaceae bacterium]